MMKEIWTVGHSNHCAEKFMDLLRQNRITAIGDVRSHPYSRHNPRFNRETLREDLKKQGIAYVFLGEELGPRSKYPSCYENGRVRYDAIAKTADFQNGLERVKKGMESFRIALMCSEKDPITCHRMILICRHLRSPDIHIRHILEDGSTEDLSDAEKRLMQVLDIRQELFDTDPESAVIRAYDMQSRKIAYIPKNTEETQEEA
ncbi:MAG: DUF488 domain-containing protein [Desulfobacterales bacterium]